MNVKSKKKPRKKRYGERDKFVASILGINPERNPKVRVGTRVVDLQFVRESKQPKIIPDKAEKPSLIKSLRESAYLRNVNNQQSSGLLIGEDIDCTQDDKISRLKEARKEEAVEEKQPVADEEVHIPSTSLDINTNCFDFNNDIELMNLLTSPFELFLDEKSGSPSSRGTPSTTTSTTTKKQSQVITSLTNILISSQLQFSQKEIQSQLQLPRTDTPDSISPKSSSDQRHTPVGSTFLSHSLTLSMPYSIDHVKKGSNSIAEAPNDTISSPLSLSVSSDELKRSSTTIQPVDNIKIDSPLMIDMDIDSKVSSSINMIDDNVNNPSSRSSSYCNGVEKDKVNRSGSILSQLFMTQTNKNATLIESSPLVAPDGPLPTNNTTTGTFVRESDAFTTNSNRCTCQKKDVKTEHKNEEQCSSKLHRSSRGVQNLISSPLHLERSDTDLFKNNILDEDEPSPEHNSTDLLMRSISTTSLFFSQQKQMVSEIREKEQQVEEEEEENNVISPFIFVGSQLNLL
eukprot:TRINITY_DN4807_c0_g1_i1.p1 TRINITY_DN4807_c0_g1~~TRINITY_DN4807_c0_g1_i1.p1  ORF type:complete len:515 (-),score=149.71 TRINITY_DN4807_c0_g1_i1:380-1924(-)